jgi:hypothetical protein
VSNEKARFAAPLDHAASFVNFFGNYGPNLKLKLHILERVQILREVVQSSSHPLMHSTTLGKLSQQIQFDVLAPSQVDDNLKEAYRVTRNFICECAGYSAMHP